MASLLNAQLPAPHNTGPKRLFGLPLRRVSFAGFISTATFLIVYYGGLAFVPPTCAGFKDYHPFAAWTDRLDLSQFVGSFLVPPWPSPFTWRLGFCVVCGGLVALVFVYALLLAWAQDSGSAAKGIAFGSALFVGLGFAVWLAGGYHPAVMRGALPDVGFFFLGWSAAASLHVLFSFVCYGFAVGKICRRR